jgi:asparagine synthetase B (glutamine-hydrolysing)
MKPHLAINYSTGDILANKGFTGNEHRLFFKDISIKWGRNLEVSRACFSHTPFFYALIENCFYASTHWGELLSMIRDYHPSINLNYVYDYLQFQCPLTPETLCDKIFFLRNGESVTLDKNGKTTGYFIPIGAGASAPLKKTLQDTLAKLNIPGSVFHISSGLDSSLLAILASQIHADRVKAITCRTRGRGASDEILVVEQLARDFNIDLTIYDFSHIDFFASGASLVKALGYPIGHPSHLVEFLLDQTCKTGNNVITGKGPDEYLAGYEWHQQQFSCPDRHFDRVCVTKPAVLNELLEDFSPPADRYVFWKDRSFLTLKDRLLYDLRSISEAWDIIHTGIASYLNINIISPFMDKQLRNSLFLLEDHLKTRNGIPKWYLRETFKDLYPDYMLQVPKRGLRLDLQPYFTDYSFSELFDLLYTSSEFSQKYIHKPLLEKMIEETLKGTRNWGWQTWSIYLCSLSYAAIISAGKESPHE